MSADELCVSLIIPVYNEETTIAACIANLSSLSPAPEVIFADGGSTDGTVDVIGGRYKVLRCEKGRANQMNAAAKEAAGDILFFSHCDSLLPPDCIQRILSAAKHGAVWGCFHIRFDGGALMKCNGFMSDARARIFHVAFGDQGMFVKKALFERMGGFKAIPIMEDYDFSRRMKRKRIPFTLLPARISTSTRRYRAGRTLITMCRMWYLRLLFRAGADIDGIAKMYRDIR